MGSCNKLLLPWGNTLVVEAVVAALVSARLHQIIVVVGYQAEAITDALATHPVHPVTNSKFDEGMSTSLCAGITAVDPSSRGCLVALGDMPAIETAVVIQLCRRFCEVGDEAIVRPAIDGRPGHPVIFGMAFRQELLALSGDRGARSIIDMHSESVETVPVFGNGIFVDVDTPETYKGHRR